MKKEYEKKKKMVILGLAAVAVCLAGGLCYYLMKIGTPIEMEKEPVRQDIEQPEVTVPEIDMTKETDVLKENEGAGWREDHAESNRQETVDVRTDSVQDGKSGEVPLTKDDSELPAEKPEIKSPDEMENPEQPPQYEPEETEPEQKPEEPAGGDTNENGQIYVPGFGYMDAPDAPASYPADSDGDWNKQIGDMN